MHSSCVGATQKWGCAHYGRSFYFRLKLTTETGRLGDRTEIPCRPSENFEVRLLNSKIFARYGPMNKSPLWFKVVVTVALLWNLVGLLAVAADLRLSAAEIDALPEPQRAMYAARPT